MPNLRVLALAVVVAAAIARAGDPPTAEARAADLAEDAARRGDEASLAAITRAEDPDPWLVADTLCARGAADAASRFARAGAGRPNTEGLTRFVAERLAAPGSAETSVLLARAASSPETTELVAALEVARTGARGFDRTRLSYALGEVLRGLARSTEAAAAMLDAADAASAIAWRSMESRALEWAGQNFDRAKEFEAARSAWSRQLEVERARGCVRRLVKCCGALGASAARLGDYRSAVRWYVEASAPTGDATPAEAERQARVLRNLAFVLRQRGEFARSLAACDEGIRRLPEPGAARERFGLLFAQGETLVRLGDSDAARRAFVAAAAVVDAANDPLRAATARAAAARARSAAGDPDGAEPELLAALAAVDAPGKNEELVMKIVANLVFACRGRKDTGPAKAYGERALALAATLKDDDSAANVMQDLMVACRNAGELDAANEWGAKSLEIAERLDSNWLRADGWREMAATAAVRKDWPAALAASRHAIAAVVRLTSGLAEGQGAQAREQFAELFRVANAAAIATADAPALFEFAESGRAVEFLASLEQGEAIRDAAIPAALRDAEERTRVAETAASLRLDAARASNDLAAAKARKAEFETARAEHEAAVARIRREARSASSIYPVAVKPEELRAALAADDAFVVYAFGGESAAALVLTKDAMRLVPLGAAKDVAAACGAWDPAADDAKADASVVAMRKALVDPLALAGTTRRVLVSPDAGVFRAPLAALFAGRELVLAPSASSYLVLAADKALSGTKTLAVGAPDHAGTRFVPLPESAAEARAVGDVVLVGKDATEEGVRDAVAKAPRWRALHFATHGVVDVKRPMRSGLALTAAAPDDGIFTAMEVVTARMPADLVVLSACDSGGGRVFEGEGLVGLPRAFLFAGSPRVIASSWRVDDAATRALMTKFHELWRGKGLRASAALLAAQDAVRAEGKWRHPRHWAAWTLWGVGD